MGVNFSRCINRIENLAQVLVHLPICHTNDGPTAPFHESVTCTILLQSLFVCISVGFDDKASRQTSKVRNIGADWMLAAEFETGMSAQTRPQDHFCIIHFCA